MYRFDYSRFYSSVLFTHNVLTIQFSLYNFTLRVCVVIHYTVFSPREIRLVVSGNNLSGLYVLTNNSNRTATTNQPERHSRKTSKGQQRAATAVKQERMAARRPSTVVECTSECRLLAVE